MSLLKKRRRERPEARYYAAPGWMQKINEKKALNDGTLLSPGVCYTPQAMGTIHVLFMAIVRCYYRRWYWRVS